MHEQWQFIVRHWDLVKAKVQILKERKRAHFATPLGFSEAKTSNIHEERERERTAICVCHWHLVKPKIQVFIEREVGEA